MTAQMMLTVEKRAVFYTTVTGELKDECTKAVMFRFINHELIKITGYVWNYASEPRKKFVWTHKNYAPGNIKICNVHEIENMVLNNTVWFNLDNGKYKDLSKDELMNIAIQTFIDKYSSDCDKMRSKIEELNNDIKYLKESKS